MTTKSPLFYVYVIRDPRLGKQNVPIYVGKGRGRRRFDHLRGASRNPPLRALIAKCRSQGLLPHIEIINHFIAEADAFAAEIALIAQFGRRDLKKGTLLNLTDGGEGQSGSLKNPFFKLNADPEFTKAAADRMRKRHTDPAYAKARDERIRKLWSNPEFRKGHDERRRVRNADPEFAKVRDRIIHKVNDDPVMVKASRERGTRLFRQLWARPEFRKAQAERNADPEFQARCQAARWPKMGKT